MLGQIHVETRTATEMIVSLPTEMIACILNNCDDNEGITVYIPHVKDSIRINMRATLDRHYDSVIDLTCDIGRSTSDPFFTTDPDTVIAAFRAAHEQCDKLLGIDRVVVCAM